MRPGEGVYICKSKVVESSTLQNKASREGRGTRKAKTKAVPPASNPCGDDDEGKRRVD